MVNVFTVHHLFAPLLALAVCWLILGPLLFGLLMPVRPHRSRGPARLGAKVPPPAGRHLDTAPIALPVTAIHGIPMRTLIPFDHLIGTSGTIYAPRRRAR